MKETLDIEGITYIQKAKYDEIEKELQNIKKMAGSTILELQRLMGQPKKIEKPKVKRGHHPKRGGYNTHKDTEQYEVPESAQKIWHIKEMTDDGVLYQINNRSLGFKIGVVLKIQKALGKNFTFKDARILRKELGLSNYTFNKLVYNYQQGIFTQYIKQWNKITQPVVGNKPLPPQNNPEKRKELGYS